LLAAVSDEPDWAWWMMDAGSIKVRPHAAGARGGHQAMAHTQGDCRPSCIGSRMPRVSRSVRGWPRGRQPTVLMPRTGSRTPGVAWPLG